MIESTPECHDLLMQLRAVILRLALISHAPSQAFNPAPPPDDLKPGRRHRLRAADPIIPHLGSHRHHEAGSMLPGYNTVPGDDHQIDHPQKSDVYFADELRRYEAHPHRTYGATDLSALLERAEASHAAWVRRPLVDGQAPAKADPEWKRYIASCGRDFGDLARQFGVSRRYINRIKAGDWSDFREKETPEDQRRREREEWERRREILPRRAP